MSLSSGHEIGSETERRFSPIHMFLRCYKLREIERRRYMDSAPAPHCYQRIIHKNSVQQLGVRGR